MIPIFNRLLNSLHITNHRVNSPNQKAKVGGTGNTVNQTNHYGAPSPAPEIFVQLDGSPAKNNFGGHISNRSSQMLVAEAIDIAGVETKLNQQFSKLCPLENPGFPPSVFTDPVDSVPVKVTYRTLDGNKYMLTMSGKQYPMAVGGFSVSFPDPASIQHL